MGWIPVVQFYTTNTDNATETAAGFRLFYRGRLPPYRKSPAVIPARTTSFPHLSRHSREGGNPPARVRRTSIAVPSPR